MNDIVERLLNHRHPDEVVHEQRRMSIDLQDAAYEIERLREQLSTIRRFAMSGEMDTIVEAEIERLREALRYYADKSNWHVLYGDQHILVDGGGIARSALEEKE